VGEERFELRGGNNHSPNASGISNWRVNFETYLPAWRVLKLVSAFFLLSMSLFFLASAHCTYAQQRHDFGEFFSELASKNFELLASLASALKILIPPLFEPHTFWPVVDCLAYPL
jgi:hypothetical protein